MCAGWLIEPRRVIECHSMSRVYRVKDWNTRRELYAGSLDQCVKFINSGKCRVNVTVTSFVGEQ